MSKGLHLPPGQFEYNSFPRFGLSQYANRFPSEVDQIRIHISGDLIKEFTLSEELKAFSKKEQVSNFHCVTTWSQSGLNWGGIGFVEFYNEFVLPQVQTDCDIKFVVFKGQDGYKTSMYLEDLLQADVMLANSLNRKPLNIDHGAPIRLIAPQHYGYKNLKHLDRIEFYKSPQNVKQGVLSFMDHPRARVALEERARGGPGWFFRYLYRPLISSTVKQFRNASENRGKNMEER